MYKRCKTAYAACCTPGLQMYLYLVKLLEDNYPEMLKRMFVINGKSNTMTSELL